VTDRRLSRYLFPVIVVAALIWLAVQTLGGSSSDTHKIRFSDALALVRHSPASIRTVTFRSSTHGVDIRLASGKREHSTYPVDDSAYALQQLLEQKGVPFDAKAPGSSAWWSILTSLLPFVLLFGFWIFLMRAVGRNPMRREEGSNGTAKA
jgi:cell division protease FtsH